MPHASSQRTQSEDAHHSGEGSAGKGIIFALPLGVVPCCRPPARRKGESVPPAEAFDFELAPVALAVPARAGEGNAREAGLEPSRPGDASYGLLAFPGEAAYGDRVAALLLLLVPLRASDLSLGREGDDLRSLSRTLPGV